ncbi:MAG TPA: aminoglycoside phosphotransferase family protein [Acidimicrobiales bacterium]|nr:aminoglycoside phosphotransferase family protein [Acidimicrobiales bacterium]
MANPMPAAEIEVTAGLVRGLLQEQHPDLAPLALVFVGEGWDNVMYRLGERYLVRLPRREIAAPLVLHEQQWLPLLARRLPIPVPVPVRIGVPGLRYPWHWSVLPWFDGEMAESAPLRDPFEAATTLGWFVRELNQAAPEGHPLNPYRGVPLASRHDVTVERIAQLSEQIDAPAITRVWDELCAAPAYDGPPLWIHGDLHPANILVRDGVIAAVIDFGDISAGDRAVDLAGGIMLFEGGALEVFRDSAGADDDDDLWRRAYGWALVHSLACLTNSADNHTINAIGRKTLAAVVRDCG